MKSRHHILAKPPTGFTLIELVITAAILILLINIVAGNYTQYVESSRRSDAASSILKLVAEQEFYFSKHKTYTTSLEELNYRGNQSANGHYAIQITDCGSRQISTCYKIAATAINGGAQYGDTQCREFSYGGLIGQQAKSAANLDTTKDCWAK